MKIASYSSYENSSDKFDIEHCQIKVKVTVSLQKFSIPFTTVQTEYNLVTLV